MRALLRVPQQEFDVIAREREVREKLRALDRVCAGTAAAKSAKQDADSGDADNVDNVDNSAVEQAQSPQSAVRTRALADKRALKAQLEAALRSLEAVQAATRTRLTAAHARTATQAAQLQALAASLDKCVALAFALLVRFVLRPLLQCALSVTVGVAGYNGLVGFVSARFNFGGRLNFCLIKHLDDLLLTDCVYFLCIVVCSASKVGSDWKDGELRKQLERELEAMAVAASSAASATSTTADVQAEAAVDENKGSKR